MKRVAVITISLIVFLLSCMVTPAGAATDAQNSVENTGLSVSWLDLGPEYVAYMLYGEASEGFYLVTALTSTNFDDGMQGKYGYINASGEIAIPFIYDEAGLFNEGLAPVTIGDKRYYIDQAGNQILDVSQYESIDSFHNGYALVAKIIQEGETNNYYYGLIDRDGNEVLPCLYGYYIQMLDDGFSIVSESNFAQEGVIDISGNIVIPIINDWCFAFGDYICVSQNEKKGLMDKTGAVILPVAYTSIGRLNEGLAAVQKDGKWGYIDETGQEVIPLQYEDYFINAFEESIERDFSEGLAAVKVDDKAGYIDADGKVVIDCQYTGAYAFKNGVATVTQVLNPKEVSDMSESSANGQYFHSLIDKTGKVVFGPKEYGFYFAGEERYIGTHDGLEGTTIVPPHNYTLTSALLDEQGNRLTNFQYYRIGDFQDGLAIFIPHYNGKYGIINRYGEEVVPALFSNILPMQDGRFFISVTDSNENVDWIGQVGILTLPADAAEPRGTNLRPITVYLNGMELFFDVPASIENDRTLVPMRKIFETFGATVSWDDENQMVNAQKDGLTVTMSIGINTALINEESVELDTPAVIRDDRTLVPLRFVAEALQAEVSWDQSNRRVIINY